MQRLVEQYPILRQALREEYLERTQNLDPLKIYDWGDIHQSVKQKLGLDIQFPDIFKLLSEARFETGMVYGDVSSGLNRFAAEGWNIAIATNGLAKYQQPLTDKLGIRYDFVLAPDISKATKPDAAFWGPLPKPYSRVIHIGDLLTHDIWGANSAGLEAAWIWRDMPPEWRETPPQERLGRPDYAEVIGAISERELEEHGFVGTQQPSQLPKPDYIVADLWELAAVIER
jgi:FMN phosphatase YigB (HAD superfamily)